MSVENQEPITSIRNESRDRKLNSVEELSVESHSHSSKESCLKGSSESGAASNISEMPLASVSTLAEMDILTDSNIHPNHDTSAIVSEKPNAELTVNGPGEIINAFDLHSKIESEDGGREEMECQVLIRVHSRDANSNFNFDS
jgi:hypothetical protein